MKDTIITIVLVVATLCLVAISVWLIIELYKDMIECRKAAKRREELIKKWANMDLTHALYIDTDSIKVNKDHCNYYTWVLMKTSCKYKNDIFYCSYHYDEKINKCNYSTCPLLHARVEKC